MNTRQRSTGCGGTPGCKPHLLRSIRARPSYLCPVLTISDHLSHVRCPDSHRSRYSHQWLRRPEERYLSLSLPPGRISGLVLQSYSYRRSHRLTPISAPPGIRKETRLSLMMILSVMLLTAMGPTLF